MAAKKQGYEKSMADLEAIVQSLESGELPLEDAVLAYERGVKLARSLGALLDGARRKVEILTEQGEAPFDEEGAPPKEEA